MNAQALLPLPVLELPDLGELDVRPRLANAKCWRGYVPESMKHPGRNHPVLVRQLLERFSSPGECVYDPFTGIGTVPVEALRLKRQAIGHEFSGAYGLTCSRNLHAVAGTATIQIGHDCREPNPFGSGAADLCLTSPPFPWNHDAGQSDEQDRLRDERKMTAGQAWGDVRPGHVCFGNYWSNLIGVWQACAAILCADAPLLVITRNAVENGEQVPYTRMVAMTIADAGFRIEGLLWRQLEPSGFQRMQMAANPAYPLVTHEDCIVARRPA